MRLLNFFIVLFFLPVFNAELINDFVSPEASVESVQSSPEVSGIKIVGANSTVLFKNGDNGLLQAVDITLDNKGKPVAAGLDLVMGSLTMDIDLGMIASGTGDYRFFIPEIIEPSTVELELKTGDKTWNRMKMNWEPQKKWEVCMIPMAHHDLGYTNPIELVMGQYRETYEDAVHFCEQTDPLIWDYLGEVEEYPEESRFRYTAEASWSIEDFIKHADEKTLEKLSIYLQDGSIEVQALYGQMITGMLSHEEMIRQMYPSFRITEKLGGEVKVAAITDIPGFSWTLPTVLAGAGIKFFFAGMPTYYHWGGEKYKKRVNHIYWDAESILRTPGQPDAFYWKGPDGSKVLVYHVDHYGCWTPTSYEEIVEKLPGKLNDMADSPFTVARYAGYACGDNEPTSMIVSDLVREWNSKWAYPKLIVSTNSMFFEKLEEQCGDDIKTFSGDLPGTDYPVGALSMAEETARNRRTHDNLHSAEKLAAMTHVLLNTPQYPSDLITEAYNNMMLYDEHCFGKGYPKGDIPDWTYIEKKYYAYKASGLTEFIASDSKDNLYSREYYTPNAGDIAKSIAFQEEGRYIVVFNSLTFKRNDLVTVKYFRDEELFEIIDTETGEPVPYQVTTIDSPLSPESHAARRFARGQHSREESSNLVFVARNVPSMGYKTYRIVPKKSRAAAKSSSLLLSDHAIENRFFKVILNPETGTVASIYDKELDRELVDPDAPHQLNQLVTRQVESGKEESPVKASIRKGKDGSVCASLLVSTSGTGCPQLTQEIILYDEIKRIDVANRILKDRTPNMEAYFAFPFQMENPDFRFEGPLSVIKPLRDQFPGSNANYYAVQHWANVSDGNTGITLAPVDAHMLEFGGLQPTVVSQAHHGVPPADYLPDFVSEMNKGHMYSFIINSNYRTNFPPTQLGDILYCYSITSHKGNWLEGDPRYFGWAAGNPLIARIVKGDGKGNLPQSLSFCRIDQPNVMLTAMKKAEDGKGLILRFHETEGVDTEVNITLPHLTIESVYKTNLVERNESILEPQGNDITINLKSFGIETVRILYDD